MHLYRCSKRPRKRRLRLTWHGPLFNVLILLLQLSSLGIVLPMLLLELAWLLGSSFSSRSPSGSSAQESDPFGLDAFPSGRAIRGLPKSFAERSLPRVEQSADDNRLGVTLPLRISPAVPF